IYVPENAPAVKVAKLHKLGAEVVQVGQKYADAYEACAKYAVESGALLCHAYDQPDICAGQGTLGIELLEQADGQLDTILVAVGGGGLLAGIAAATEGQARVIGVEPSNAPMLHAALAAGPSMCQYQASPLTRSAPPAPETSPTRWRVAPAWYRRWSVTPT